MVEAAKVMEVTTLVDLTRAVREVGRLILLCDAREAEMNKRINAIKAEYPDVEKAKNRKLLFEAAVEDACKRNMEWFGSGRTITTTWGEILARKAPDSLEIMPGWADEDGKPLPKLFKKLRELGLEKGIKTVDYLAKSQLKGVPEADLAKCGLRPLAETKISIKPDQEKIRATITAEDAKVA